MKCNYIINPQKYNNLKSYLLSFKRDEEDWDKWVCNFVEIVSQFTNHKIEDKSIITFQLFSESVLLGYKLNVIHKDLLNSYDYGRFLIGLMSKIKSFDSLTVEEKKYFAFCIILTCCCYENIETGLSAFTTIDNVIREYNNWNLIFFDTFNNFPNYDSSKPLGSKENPITVVSWKDVVPYFRKLNYSEDNSYYLNRYHREQIKGFYGEDLAQYTIDVKFYNPRKSCTIRPFSLLTLNVNENGIKISDNPPVPTEIYTFLGTKISENEFSFHNLVFKPVDSIKLSKILLGFSEFCLQCVSSEKFWDECGLTCPSKFGLIQSWFASKDEKIERAFLEKEFYALVSGIMIRSFVDCFLDYLSQAENFVHLIIGYQFYEHKKSDSDAYFYDVLSLAKDYLYLNLVDEDIFTAHAILYGVDVVHNKKILVATKNLIQYCYDESESFLEKHSSYKIINDIF